MQEYDGCSDELIEEGAYLLKIYPPDNNALSDIKAFIADHNLTGEDVKIIKNEYGMSLITKRELTLTLLHEGKSPFSVRPGEM